MLQTLADLGSVVGSFSLIIAAIALIREMRTQNLQNLFYLHQYLSQDELSNARRRVRTEIHRREYHEWNDEDREAASRVCASYDQAGLLIGAGVLNDQARKLLLSSSWGESICDQYESLQPFLYDQQTPSRTGFEFFQHFTALYNEATKFHRAS